MVYREAILVIVTVLVLIYFFTRNLGAGSEASLFKSNVEKKHQILIS